MAHVPRQMTPHDEPIELPPCVECGACCNFDDSRYAMVLADDSARLTPEDEPLTHWTGGRCFMRVVDGHCAALNQIEGMSWCTIYERRPQGCRDAARGGPDCLAGLARRARRLALEGESSVAAI